MRLKLPLSITILLVTLVTVLAMVNWDIYQKEQQLAHGKIVRLALAPVDPRSLMQGDYMSLNYAIAAPLSSLVEMETGQGLLQVGLDHNLVASLVSVDEEAGTDALKQIALNQGDTKATDEIINIQYRVRHNQVKFASNAYFFEEGQAKRYEAAKYGQFRVNELGALLLESLLDKDFKPL
ncbi:GDYXXLXY domain-containing protein [Shewanella schlegeliana]|uniref:GDYXXLXY domain-containing protein n=1 Tax=Shewanella schlegeliana TaxID=190308 RepID=A0ABS1T2R1_9GAMM|nr:GDYXXLXY domain-containing protein [Shewanella schlegeliana]MBL4915090.1 GDYXXLXY domain-containing protein [Shewanella schlegeliana]MCL1111044.1 GDYXXLXY domain-containing protein [Shewanella schlegeliana]GIU29074.1 membrane protein [Shewanella schlegeliana]